MPLANIRSIPRVAESPFESAAPAMRKNTTHPPIPKKVIAVQQDLLPRLLQTAGELRQNPNQSANLLIEGGLHAMDAEGAHDSPFVQLYRSLKGKTLLTTKAVMTLCSVILPGIHRMDPHEKRFLFDLLNKHDGPLTSGLLKSYRQLSARMNTQRLEYEKQVARIRAGAELPLG